MKMLLTALLCSGLLQTVTALGDEVPAWLKEGAWTRPLWTGPAPGETRQEPPVLKEGKGGGVLRVQEVTVPTITFFPAGDAGSVRPAVVICPGGGYSILAIDKEGTDIAQWLNTLGVHAFVLQYRVPGKRDPALEDARRALRMVRHHAAAWGVDPERLGMLGFSAGGHLTARTAASHAEAVREPADAVDQQSSRPDFSVLIYPAYLSEKAGPLKPEIRLAQDHPPVFITQARDDRGHIHNSLNYYRACVEQAVPAELHLYPQGGHGYGMRPGKRAAEDWPRRCRDWLTELGVLKSG